MRCAFTTIAFCLGLLGCQVYDASLVGDSSTASCTTRKPPERPAMGDGDNGVQYHFGLREVVLEQGGETWREIGFDLDDRCTDPGSFDTECTPPERPRPPVDGEEGIDNTFGSLLFPLVELVVSGLQVNARAAQESGSTPVLRLRGWNGEDNDSRVDVAVLNAIFTIPAGADDMPQDFMVVDFTPQTLMGGMFEPPRWDGTDFGYFRLDNFFEGDSTRPLFRDDNAYVSNRFVVASLPERVEILFPAETAGLQVLVTDGVAVGRILEDESGIEDVIVAGRWAVLDLLATAENVGVCRGTDNYMTLNNQLGAIADIRSLPGSGGEGVECDAISIGVVFQGTRMRFGDLTPGPPLVNLCEAMMDGGVPDGGLPDDGGTDGGPGTDAGTDAGFDAGVDAGPVDGG